MIEINATSQVHELSEHEIGLLDEATAAAYRSWTSALSRVDAADKAVKKAEFERAGARVMADWLLYVLRTTCGHEHTEITKNFYGLPEGRAGMVRACTVCGHPVSYTVETEDD